MQWYLVHETAAPDCDQAVRASSPGEALAKYCDPDEYVWGNSVWDGDTADEEIDFVVYEIIEADPPAIDNVDDLNDDFDREVIEYTFYEAIDAIVRQQGFTELWRFQDIAKKAPIPVRYLIEHAEDFQDFADVGADFINQVEKESSIARIVIDSLTDGKGAEETLRAALLAALAESETFDRLIETLRHLPVAQDVYESDECILGECQGCGSIGVIDPDNCYLGQDSHYHLVPETSLLCDICAEDDQ